MINQIEKQRQAELVKCNRCGGRKEREKFHPEDFKKIWCMTCITCKNTPVGQIAKR